ncbi:hypothetical protein M378DRAFT_172540 [Amanita muscaria Koide BX008]|uniref:Uncharacterized protein n=1 Tax=Amanita muscaria (strain Koide BX008) TaxID=946122 RepID=A0A0C2WKB6_AMAMK|nr:hypothetical protein M378DRAFT_172918 [Amanita muscaria Koide BX008]KIL56608.1 hypothetical protein M378DRAFT_172540 [Amanita muscaria Koide BX008]
MASVLAVQLPGIVDVVRISISPVFGVGGLTETGKTKRKRCRCECIPWGSVSL